MTVHVNSIITYHSLDLNGRREKVLDVYRKSSRPLTDREVMSDLGYTDPNMARPRITELIDMGYLREAGSVKDTLTKKTVRLVELAAGQMTFL